MTGVDPKLRSWVESANSENTDFPIQNLPFGVFRRNGDVGRVGVAIGDQVLDLAAAGVAEASPTLNAIMALGPDAMNTLREAVTDLLRWDAPERERAAHALIDQRDCEMLVPAAIGDYTDFYASLHHATNVGRLFRPDQPLLPNYKYVPIGYHGRASSILASCALVRRPSGQTRPSPNEAPVFGPSRRLDYELELGFFIGQGNALGTWIPIAEAREHIFGYCLVNDWSARDIQAWEYQPLGPFLAKSFATTVSPWVVPAAALEPFRTAAVALPEGDPQPLEYLQNAADQREGALDITLEVALQTPKMRSSGVAPVRISRGNFRDMYWTVAQMLAHHSSNGCNLRSGDLLASGTVSGPLPENRGCLLELTSGGSEPVQLPNGESRRFLEDGDEVVLRGRCEREGCVSIGFGECRGRITEP